MAVTHSTGKEGEHHDHPAGDRAAAANVATSDDKNGGNVQRRWSRGGRGTWLCSGLAGSLVAATMFAVGMWQCFGR